MRIYDLKDPKEICKNGRVTAVDLHNTYFFVCVQTRICSPPQKKKPIFMSAKWLLVHPLPREFKVLSGRNSPLLLHQHSVEKINSHAATFPAHARSHPARTGSQAALTKAAGGGKNREKRLRSLSSLCCVCGANMGRVNLAVLRQGPTCFN